MSTRDEEKNPSHLGEQDRPVTGLRREIDPPTDLWKGIARRIDATADPNAPLPEVSQRLAREAEPVRDLWPAIQRRIEGREPRPVAESTGQSSWLAWTGWAVAAAALVLAFQLPGTLDQATTPDLQVANAPEALSLPIEQARSGRLEARGNLLRVLAEDSSISPATRAIVERNLATIDQALEEIQHALAADPGNATLYRLLHATYRQEAEIVAQMTRRGQHPKGSL